MDPLESPTPKSARQPYVRQACAECKRRKTKCDGCLPCWRCKAQSVCCMYAVKPRHGTRSKIAKRPRLEEAPGKNNPTGPKAMSAITTENSETSTATSGFAPRSKEDCQSLEFMTGSTSSLSGPCSFLRVDANLDMVGADLIAAGNHDDSSSSPGSDFSLHQLSGLTQFDSFLHLLTTDPLWDITREHAMALVDQWSSGPGLLYPLVDPQKMLDKIHSIFTFAEHARKGDIQRLCSTQMRFNHETNKLKLVLAISHTLEAGGWNHEAQRLFQSATETLNGLIWNSNGINNIEILILLALYHYYLDEEVLAGRITTLAARLCIEMGLHRRTVLEAKFPDIDERLDALRTFWSVLMLERSTSISQGIPFMIPDPHADPSLISLLGHMSSQAALSTRSPLRDKPSSALFALLEWSKLAGRAWHALNTAGEGDSEMRLDDLDYLDYQVVQWYEEVPEDLRMNPSGLKQRDEQHDSTCIQGVLYCQKAQLRNLIYQPMLELTAPITRNGTRTLRAVEIAKETLHMLADLNDKSPLVRTHPILFKQSLVAASRNLLSAVANGGSAFLENSKVEIRIALRLVGLLKMRSTFLTQLWQQLQGLQEMYPTRVDFPDNKALFSEYDDYRSSGFEDLFQLHPCV